MHRPGSASVRLERRVLVSPVVRLTATRHATQPPRSPAVHNQLQHQLADSSSITSVATTHIHTAKTFSNTHTDRSLKPLLMRPSLVLVRKALDRMWFRRHWYWPTGYIVVGIIVALLTNNIHLSSLSGILLSILAVLLWPFILGAALCRLLGFHIPGLNIT